MSGSFLRLDLDKFGMKAMCFEQRGKSALLREECSVLFKDLPEPEDTRGRFDAGLAVIAQQIDLKSCSTAVIFVSSRMVSFRNLELPFKSEKKISQILSFELEPSLPYTHEPCISVFHRTDMGDNSNSILAASFPEFYIETYFSRLKDFDIKPVIITPRGYAEAIIFLQERKDLSSFIFLHTTACEYTLVLVIDRKPVLVRFLSTAQYEPGQLASGINQTILGFTQRTGLTPLLDIFISSTVDAEKTEQINNSFGSYLETRSVLDSNEPKDLKNSMLVNVTTPSLSFIRPETRMKYLVNFCTGKYGSSSILKTYFTHFAAGFVLLILLFGLSLFSIHRDISHLNQKITAVDKKALMIYHESFPGKIKVQDPYLEMKANVKAALKNSGTDDKKDGILKNQDILVSEVILELSSKLDPSIDVDASKLSFNEDRLILSGSTDNFNNVDKMKNSIEESDLFEKVTISSAAMDKKENRVNFKFIIEM